MRFWVLLLSFGCVGEDGPKPDETGETGATCAITLDETYPTDGETDVYYRTALDFEFSDADPLNGLSCVVDGVTDPVVADADDDTVHIEPDPALEPNTSYTATCTWCGGTETISFSTSALGAPVADRDALVGRVFGVPFDECRIAEPAALRSQLADYIDQADLLRIDGVGEGTIAMTNGFAVYPPPPWEQDTCLPTYEFDPGDFTEDPYFEVATDTMVMSFSGIEVTLHEVQFHGTFAEDGLSIGGGELTYWLDTRPLDVFVDPDEEGSMCDTAERLGAPCYDCPDSGEEFCLTFVLDQCEGESVDVAIEEIPCADCAGCDATGFNPATCTC